MEPGEICTEVHEIPTGEGLGVYEAPRGEVLHYVRSDGGNMPMRHKIRAPSFNNILSNEYSVRGSTIADAGLITAAVDPCYSCTERVGVIDQGSDDRYILSEGDLIRLSQEKTEEIRKRFAKE
jgi:NADH-quinone oxidoreductase subunit D